MYKIEPLLIIILFLPTIPSIFYLVACLLNSREKIDGLFYKLSVFYSLVVFLVSLGLLYFVPMPTGNFLNYEFVWSKRLGIKFSLIADGLSIVMIILSTFLTSLVIIGSKTIQNNRGQYLSLIFFLEFAMIGTFLANDLFLFYVFWELLLIPMYFMIGIWGSENRIYATVKFVIFTAFGSLLMLIAIAYLYFQHYEQYSVTSLTLNDLLNLNFQPVEGLLLFLAFALAFCIKVPVFPLHTWLPDAHVQAPTGGSVLLAGVMLKVGLYGLFRFAVPLFTTAAIYSSHMLVVLGVIGIVFGALVAWRQTDMKKLVAYSSVSHLGYCVVGFGVFSLMGMQGSLLQMINHGISTSALFFLVGALYERKHSKKIADYGGLAQKLPVFSFFFLVFTLSSIGLPLTNGFVGEFLILASSFTYSPWVGVFAVSGVILGAIYMLSMYRRVCFGEFDESKNSDLKDLDTREILILTPLCILVFLIGVYPAPLLSILEPSSIWMLQFVEITIK